MEPGLLFGQDAGPHAAAAAGGSLPCLNSNNSTEALPLELQTAINKLQGNHRKTAFALSFNVKALCEKHGIDYVGFLTLTFADHVLCPKVASRRFNSLASHVLNSRYSAWVKVGERQRSGRIHFHLLVVLKANIRRGVDFAAFEAGDYRSAGADLRGEWAFWRRTARLYSFGRTELLPVKSTHDGISKYVGKYIEKHILARKDEDKGWRLVSYSRDAQKASCRFGWNSPGAWVYRRKMEGLQRLTGIRSEELQGNFGQRYGFALTYEPEDCPRIKGVLAALVLADLPGGVTYPSALHYAADLFPKWRQMVEDVGYNCKEVTASTDFESLTGVPITATDIRVETKPCPYVEGVRYTVRDILFCEKMSRITGALRDSSFDEVGFGADLQHMRETKQQRRSYRQIVEDYEKYEYYI